MFEKKKETSIFMCTNIGGVYVFSKKKRKAEKINSQNVIVRWLR